MKRSITAVACAAALACLLTLGSSVQASDSASLQIPAAKIASPDLPIDLAQQTKVALPADLATALKTSAPETTMVAQGYGRRLYRRPFIRPRYRSYGYYGAPRTLNGYPYVNMVTQPHFPGYPGFVGGRTFYIPYNGIYY